MSRRTMGMVVLVAVFLVAAGLAAYLEWLWWHPTSGAALVIGLAATVALVIAGALALIPGGARRAALLPLAVTIGLVAGTVLGPSREPLVHGDGTITFAVERPEPTTHTRTVGVICYTVESGRELRIEADVELFVGDRWRTRGERTDDINLEIWGGDGLVHYATDTSVLETTWNNRGGSARFDGLVASHMDDRASRQPSDLAGTITWTCPG